MNSLRAEFIDIIEWENQSGDVLVHRFERHDNEIKNGAQLIVRPGQRAVFVNEGQIADSFGPGTYRLETKNLPILATLKGWKYGFDSPFKAEVYFVNATELLDRKWGTPSPVMLRDADFGAVRLRARGNFSYKVGATKEMLSRFVGSRDEFRVDEIEGQLRTRIVSSFSDALGEMKIPALDLLTKYDELGAEMRRRLSDIFEDLGLDLLSFTVENISVPEAVQKALDERASMGAVGNLNNYAKFQAANAMRDAASNEGGMAGGMLGMMVGGQLGGVMGGAMQQNSAATVACPKCGAAVEQGAKFCGNCGSPMASAVAGPACSKCGSRNAPGSKFCGNCGSPLQAACVKCGKELDPAAKFCPACGAPQA